MSGTFAGLGTYIPLMLVSVHHVGPRLAGISLAVTGTLWAAGSALASRDAVRSATTPAQRVRAGLLLMATGSLGPLALALGAVGLGPGMLGWAVSALGMGLAFNTLSVHTVEIAPAGAQGEVNAAATLAASIGVSLATAAGGALVAAHAERLTGTVFAVILVGAAGVALVGAARAHRITPPVTTQHRS